MSKKEQLYRYTTFDTVEKCLSCFSSRSEFTEFLGAIKNFSEIHNQVYHAANLFKISEGQMLDIYTRFVIMIVDILKERRELLMDLMKYARVEEGTKEDVQKHLHYSESCSEEHFNELLRIVNRNWVDFDEDEESEIEEEEL